MYGRRAACTAMAAALTAASLSSNPVWAGSGSVDWATYNGSPTQTHYSELNQINRSNVRHLAVAWRFDTGETGDMLTNPLVIDGMLYGVTPSQKIIALDSATGKLKWKFDSGIHGKQPIRGLAHWGSGREHRILVGVMNYLYALDAHTGNPIDSFGVHGRVDLREALGRLPVEAQSIALTTPGIVYKDLIIVGGREPETLPSPPGDVRAFDVRTGVLRWTFHTIPHPGEVGYDTWPQNAWRRSGSANNWAGMALDAVRGILFVPTGPPADYYGADRVGDNLFGNCLLALDAGTGKRLWHFQAVKHDLWDRDLPAPPTLLTITRDNRKVDAVAQVTKQGFVFLFDRVTGQPLFPIVERGVPSSEVPGEIVARTQPFPTLPAPFARQELTEDMLTTRTPTAHEFAIEQFRTFVSSRGPFVPLALGRSTVVFPGFDGGAEWGGTAVDPRTGVLYVNSNDVAWTGSLVKLESGERRASELYQYHCAACHGADRKGSPPAFPSLIEVSARLSAREMENIIGSGRGRMPGFAGIPDSARIRLVDFLRTGVDSSLAGDRVHEASTEGDEADASPPSAADAPTYVFTGYKKFLDPDGYPAIVPPWGTLSAINLNTGQYLWHIPLGEYPELTAKGLAETGTENYGGPIVTAGGLLFIAATLYDQKFRAFDSATGKLLWSASLPFSGVATPATYKVKGCQYVVIATSNARNPHAPQGSAYVAFALPTPRVTSSLRHGIFTLQ
jgi:quinoprotein glucose dehydrogenase